MEKLGNQLLKEVFEEHVFDNHEWVEEVPFHPQEPIQNISKFRPRDVGKLPPSVDTENMGPEVSEIIRTRGIHAIAWYLPYRFYGEHNWGIYFDSIAMTRLSIEIATIARTLEPNITNTQARKVLYAEVMRHEIEHAIQELILAKSLEAGTIDVARVKSASFSQKRSYRETTASHFEHMDMLQSVGTVNKRHVNIIRHVIESQGEPPVYCEWRSRSIIDLDLQYERELGVAPQNQGLSNVMRDLVGGKPISKYLDIPTYSWKGNGLKIPLNGIDLRAQSVDCKKLKRFMVKDGLARYFNDELMAVPAPDHSLKILNSNSRPIKFDCHDWDTVPDRVVSQIATAIGIDKSEFVDRIRTYL